MENIPSVFQLTLANYYSVTVSPREVSATAVIIQNGLMVCPEDPLG